jgi:hypothetical protein
VSSAVPAPEVEVDEVRAWRVPGGRVRLLFPTDARPNFRIVHRTPLGERKQPSAGRDLDTAWAKACDIDAMLAGQVADPTGRIVNDLLNAWLPAMKDEWSPTHWDKYHAMSQRFVSPLLGQASAWNLSKEAVATCASAPSAKSARRHLGNTLGAMLTWGHAND